MDIGSDKSSDNKDVVHEARMSDLADYLKTVTGARVINPGKVAKCSQLYLVLIKFKHNNVKRFRRNLCVSPTTFNVLMSKIEGDPVFANKLHANWTAVEIQLADALYCFGHNGNATSVESIAQWAGLSTGIVIKCTHQVIMAFLGLHDSVIQWPSESEKEDAKEWVRSVSCDKWVGGYCMVNSSD